MGDNSAGLDTSGIDLMDFGADFDFDTYLASMDGPGEGSAPPSWGRGPPVQSATLSTPQQLWINAGIEDHNPATPLLMQN
jgi:hypothetical protein